MSLFLQFNLLYIIKMITKRVHSGRLALTKYFCDQFSRVTLTKICKTRLKSCAIDSRPQVILGYLVAIATSNQPLVSETCDYVCLVTLREYFSKMEGKQWSRKYFVSVTRVAPKSYVHEVEICNILLNTFQSLCRIPGSGKEMIILHCLKQLQIEIIRKLLFYFLQCIKIILYI